MKHEIEIWHNPNCSKSCSTFAKLTDRGYVIKRFDYLQSPISKISLQNILIKMNLPAFSIVRTKEKLYEERFKNTPKSEDEWLDILIQFPELIERPIVVYKDKAVIARPAEKVEELF